MLELLFKILAFIVAVSILVAVHEYGHFWVARKLGFKVLRFSIGFGRPLLRWTGGGEDRVEYWLSSLPLGGYVKLLDEREGPVDEADRDRAFNRRPIPHRIAVLAAGPAFNFIFAIVAYWAMFMAGIPGIKPVVSAVAPDSIAAEAGLRADDTITAVNGREVETWEGATLSLLDELLASGLINLSVETANGDTRTISLDLRGLASELTQPDALFSGLGIRRLPVPPADVGSITPGSAADSAGLLVGDRIASGDGTQIRDWNDLVSFVRARPNSSVQFIVTRDGGTVLVPIAIPVVEVDGQRIGQIGVGPVERMPADVIERLTTEQQFGPVAALTRATSRTWEMSALTVRMLGRMLVGDVSVRNVSGPITIADYAGDSAEAGFSAFLSFLAIVSISLGILNLLPVPLLDGGQIVYQIAELIKGTPLSEKAMMVGQQIGLLFFVVLTSFVIYNDLTRVFG